MDPDELFQYGELVYLDDTDANYASWKRSVEALTGETMEPTEATTMYDMISGRMTLS